MKDDIEERAMNVHATVVVIDEAQLAEPVHEETDPGTSGADHVGERFLTDLGNDRLGFDSLCQKCAINSSTRASRFSLELKR